MWKFVPSLLLQPWLTQYSPLLSLKYVYRSSVILPNVVDINFRVCFQVALPRVLQLSSMYAAEQLRYSFQSVLRGASSWIDVVLMAFNTVSTFDRNFLKISFIKHVLVYLNHPTPMAIGDSYK